MKQKTDKVNNAETTEADQREVKPEQNAAPEANDGAAQASPLTAEEEAASEVTDWEAKAKEQEKQAAELLDRLQRTMAEFDNYRKRTIKEKSTIYNDGVGDTLEKLLPVVDNFERALAAFDDKESSLYKGIDMIFRQLSDILKRSGVEAVPGEGGKFDPNVHHAVAHVEDENLEENVVVEVLQKGYKYKEKVLRPSMVKVAN